MTVRDLIEKLQEFPLNTPVVCVIDTEPNEEDDPFLVWGEVSEVEMCNDHGNEVRLS